MSLADYANQDSARSLGNEKYPPLVRLAIILGLSSGLWGVILLVGWTLFRGLA